METGRRGATADPKMEVFQLDDPRDIYYEVPRAFRAHAVSQIRAFHGPGRDAQLGILAFQARLAFHQTLSWMTQYDERGDHDADSDEGDFVDGSSDDALYSDEGDLDDGWGGEAAAGRA